MINKEGKIFGKVSIIDILAVVLVVVMAIGVYTRFFKAETKVKTNTSVIEYDMIVKGVRQGTVDAISKGGPVYDVRTKEYMGEVVNSKFVAAPEGREKADGTIVNSNLPDKYDVTFTVRVEGNVNNSGFYTSGNQMLCAGSKYVINTKFARTTAKIINIREGA